MLLTLPLNLSISCLVYKKLIAVSCDCTPNSDPNTSAYVVQILALARRSESSSSGSETEFIESLPFLNALLICHCRGSGTNLLSNGFKVFLIESTEKGLQQQTILSSFKPHACTTAEVFR